LLSLLRRYLPLLTLFVAVASFYLYNLNGVGLLGPDEPRYAAIGRSMAQTGDWITPSLWGSPWFEKPPLLYWLTAVATALGAGPEISARLPVALLSLAFLCVFCGLLAREFGWLAAIISTAALASSAGWIAYSNLCLTDLPLSCFFALSVLLLLPMLRETPDVSRMRLLVSGVCLGFAVLAKGLVPLVLLLPVCWFLRRYWRVWWLPALTCLLVALPWYVIVYQRNGQPFVEDFFLKQQFERLYSKSLQHVQPWYFYLPVLLGILFPWTPLFGMLFNKRGWDARRKFLLAIILFGLLFFSLSLNKLPGYLLPLVPLLFAVLGGSVQGRTPFRLPRHWLIPSALLAALIPPVAEALPSLLSAGRISAFRLGHFSATSLFYMLAPVAVVMLARRSWVPALLVLCVVGGGFFVKIRAFPPLDRQVSARVFWNRQIQPLAGNVCEEWIKRDWVYGLSFYAGQLLPPCYLHPAEWHLLPRPGTPGLARATRPIRAQQP
jgi:4-amino-4-deoxy-L-arabinose transferase-like glycosyltransferase